MNLALTLTLFLKCSIFYDSNLISETKVELQENQKNLILGEVEEYEVLLSSLGKNKVELQTYNSYEPARTYSVAHIDESSREIELSIWKRESLIEIKCSLYK